MIIVSKNVWRWYLSALFLAGLGVVICSLLLLRTNSLMRQAQSQDDQRTAAVTAPVGALEHAAAQALLRERALRASVTSLQLRVRELEAETARAPLPPRSSLGSTGPSEAGAVAAGVPLPEGPSQQAATPVLRTLPWSLDSFELSGPAFPSARKSNPPGVVSSARVSRVAQDRGLADSKSAYLRRDFGPSRARGHWA